RLGLSPAEEDFHSLSWLHYEYLQQGRFAKARGLVQPVQLAMAEVNASGPPEGRPHDRGLHHVESEIGRGFGQVSLKGEAASMRARLVVESGRWEEMKGQASFDNVDELFALGISSARLGDIARAEAALEHLQNARRAAPDTTNKQ